MEEFEDLFKTNNTTDVEWNISKVKSSVYYSVECYDYYSTYEIPDEFLVEEVMGFRLKCKRL